MFLLSLLINPSFLNKHILKKKKLLDDWVYVWKMIKMYDIAIIIINAQELVRDKITVVFFS